MTHHEPGADDDAGTAPPAPDDTSTGHIDAETVAALQRQVHAFREAADAARDRLRDAAARYRDLLVRAEPSLPQELVTGDDIDAVEASAEAARAIVGRIRARMESEAAADVPRGVASRTAPALDALSPDEKIRIGLARRAG